MGKASLRRERRFSLGGDPNLLSSADTVLTSAEVAADTLFAADTVVAPLLSTGTASFFHRVVDGNILHAASITVKNALYSAHPFSF